MTVDPARLLQMLEPTVRPGNLSATSGMQQAKPAFENRAFDDLLSEAKATTTTATQSGGTKSGEVMPTPPAQFFAMGGLGQVENAALRNVLAQSHGSGSGMGKTG
ncbi:MAG: hypothetical protein AB8C95_09695 [Phycisphaeraceae bacterium]